MVAQAVVRASRGLGGLVARLNVLEHRARMVSREIARLFDEYMDDLHYLAVNRACVDGFCFERDGRGGYVYYRVRNSNGEIVAESTRTGIYVTIHGISVAEEFLDRFHDILACARAYREVEKEIKKLENILEKAEDLARIYGDESIIDEALAEIQAYLDEPRILG